ncbi:MAG: L-histidine N(alpha)-methyltransferase, partial [Calditrichaeota bacterium]|nr:L-histidine N(alpha)-methyltransferase [Calditrichota bacterium]
MKATYRVLTPQDLDNGEITSQTFALEVLTGLSENPKRLQSKYFYDDEGSRLFQQIMAL